MLDEPLNSLDGWVAYRAGVFDDASGQVVGELPPNGKKNKKGHRFMVAWNIEECKLAVTFIEGHRKVSDKRSKSHACVVR